MACVIPPHFPIGLGCVHGKNFLEMSSGPRRNSLRQTTFKYLIVDGKLTPRLKSLHELLDDDVIEVESNFVTAEEVMCLLDRYVELREELNKFMEHIDDFTVEQRGEMARVLAETEYLKKDCTLRDIVQIIERLDQVVEHYSQP